ncbi:MAG: tetratricopeptide repeat protein [Muribaculum sp.]|nr:tetratricopeptide repeat protein [Muribaculum sp.]
MRKSVIILITCILNILSVYGQEEWESAIPSGLKWDVNYNLSSYSTSLSNLKVANLIPETKENKKNHKVQYYSVDLNYQIKETRPFEISVDVTNLNSRPDYKYAVYEGKNQKWHTKEIYWGYQVGVNTTTGGTAYYNRYFSDNKSDSYSYTSVYDSDYPSWTSHYGSKEHSLKVEYDGDHTIRIFDNGSLVKTFNNAKSVCYFGFRAGTASQIQATNFNIRRKSNYGMAKPRIDEAMTKMSKEDWYNAARDLTYVIETLKYTNFDILFARGFAYAMQEHYKTAIEDFTKALNQYGITTENRESAYYLRGLCRANIGDEQCITDMRNAGQDGKIWLRENDLENYVVGSGSNSSQSNNNQSGSNSRFLPKKFRSGNN